MSVLKTVRTVDSYFYNELSSELNEVRKRRNMTIAELAQEVGVSPSNMDRYLLGHYKFTKEMFDRICRALSIPSIIDVKVSVGLRESRKDR